MNIAKLLVITVIILLSLATGYLQGMKKRISLIALGLMCAFYLAYYYGK